MRSRTKVRAFSSIVPLPFVGGRFLSLAFIGLALLILMFSLLKPQSVSGLRVGIADIVAPVLSTVSRPFYQFGEFIGGVSGMAELRAENTQLKAENERLREWYQTALMLQSENQSLQELLNLKTEPHHKFVTTRVIADSGNAYVKSVLIAAGRNDRVRKGQAVLAGEGMIGRIIETGNNAARVLLLTDFNSRTPVLVEGSRHHAILSGENTDLAQLKHLPPDSDIEEGMRIVTSGHGGLFPPGLPVGRVEKDARGQFAVRPYADTRRVTHVRVLDASADPNLQLGVLSAGE